jgi:hypothetical protein
MFCSRLMNRGGSNGSPAFASKSTHRASGCRKGKPRPTIADIEEIIQHSRKVIDDSRDAMRRVDDLLQETST